MAKEAGYELKDLLGNPAARKNIKLQQYVSEEVGLPTLEDIMAELAKPGRDPRKQFEIFSFAEGVEKPTDLITGMKRRQVRERPSRDCQSRAKSPRHRHRGRSQAEPHLPLHEGPARTRWRTQGIAPIQSTRQLSSPQPTRPAQQQPRPKKTEQSKHPKQRRLVLHGDEEREEKVASLCLRSSLHW